MWTIDKSFSACFGHRVWSQKLDLNYTSVGDTLCKCRHLHGHEMLIKVFLESDSLTRGMVVDFKMLGWFKDFMDDVIDHKFMMDINDPLLAHELPHLLNFSGEFQPTTCKHNDVYNYWTPNTELLSGELECVVEKYDGMVLVDFVPTSENLCVWLYNIVAYKMRDLDIRVSAVEYWETPKSHCRYEGVK